MKKDAKSLLEGKIKDNLKLSELIYDKIENKGKEVKKTIEEAQSGDNIDYESIAVEYKCLVAFNMFYQEELSSLLSATSELYRMYELMVEENSFTEEERSRLDYLKFANKPMFSLKNSKLETEDEGMFKIIVDNIAKNNTDGEEFVMNLVSNYLKENKENKENGGEETQEKEDNSEGK